MKFSTLLLKQSVRSVLKYLRKPVRFIPATFQKAIFLFLFSFIVTRSFSQQVTWALSAGGSSIDISTTVAKDNAGNVYIAGKFSGANVDFDPSPGVFLLSSAGGTDAFVAKYNAAGQFQWAFRFGGNSLDEVQGIALDQNDNFFITGYFRGLNIDFDPGPGAANVSSNGDTGVDPGYGGDIFIAKYNSAGAYQWAFNIGGTELYDAGIGISTDAAGNVYAGGYFTHTADFDPSAGIAILNSAVSGSIFLAKYSTNGVYQWAFGLGSPVTNNALHDIKTDAVGNVYITGYYQGTNLDFDPGPGVVPLSANGGYEIFVAKYNANGQYQLAFSVGGPGWDVARGIGLDNAGNIYIIGDFNNTVDFDPGPGTAFLTSNGQNDAVLAKYSPAGQYMWAFGFGGTPNEYGSKVIIDNAHVFITGSFSGTADLDPSVGVENLTSAGGYDIYLGKYTLDGEYLCSFRVGGPGDDGGHALVSTAPNVFCLTGFFSGNNIDFDPGATTLNLSSAGAEDIFLAKYTWPDNVPPTGTLTGDVICSGEQAQLTFTATAGTGPFTITYNNGATDIVQTNVQSGVPFNITPNPSFTTIYSLVGIRDALRCSETNGVSQMATVTVNNCSPCNNWLNLPSFQSYVRVGDLDVPGNQITVEAVFTRTTSYTGGQVWAGDLVSKHNTPSDANYLLRPNNAEITTTNGYFRTPDICEIELNKTYHAAMVYDGATLKFYRNGFLMSSVQATGNLFQNDFQTRIGLYDAIVNNTNLIGYINEVRIWNVTRSQAEIRTYMNSSLPAPATQTGLLAYYTFDDLLNKQGNPAWNGTLGGAASINQTNNNCAFTADSCSILQEQIINDYTEVLSFDICKNNLSVSDASAFNVGDTVLLIQMKGAVIDSTNTASFGMVTNYKNAGNYEFNYVKAKNGNQIELLNIVERQYDLPNGKVQLIRVPYFQDYNVTASLTCLPWNGSIGGVLAFNVQNTLTLNEDINVSGKGFRGGKGVNTDQTNTFCFANNYSYAFGSILAAEKGESIVELSNNFMLGKGNTAGGGGGGNDHNSGGGGGANGGIGGFGGYQYEPCGSAPFDNRGIGGRVLPYSNAANKIFMGSGGGAGHANNQQNINVPSDGGHGGGILLISAQTLISNAHKIVSNGADAPVYVPSAAQHCHEAMGGGGAGGTILLNISTIQDNTTAELNGGKGANMTANVPLYGRIGPGGGGGGGVLWSSAATMPANLAVSTTGGANGVLTTDSNNPWGTTPGQAGFNLFGLVVPVDDILFRPNIDSVRIKDSITGCSSFDFKGFGYTNTYPVISWQWFFGDGNTANAQNTTYTFTSSGTFTVKLIITDINGCKDSIAKDITTTALDIDFSYQLNACSPLTVQFNSIGSSSQNSYWSFGDATTVSGVLNPVHTYPSENTYIVKYSASNGACTDTVTKTITLTIIPGDIVLTRDTTICFGATKQLLTKPALSFCWNPTTYLNDPNSANPITSTPQNIIYYYTAEITGNNLVVNGDFSQGNTGFTSQYTYASVNTAEGQYFVGTNPSAWGGGFQNCGDHTSLNGNMMIVNAVQAVNVNDIVWEETLTVLPNTNYAFSTWILSLQSNNAGQVQFSINGRNIGGLINAVTSSCNWAQFYTTWNSGNNTTAVISIINKLTIPSGNDFALDDISFAPVFIKRDSVIITVENPIVRTNNDTTVCPGIQVQLIATGAVGYSWSPITGLNNSGISNPLASPLTTTQYIVSGTSLNGCLAKDTVNITVYPKPGLITSNDTTICKNSLLQLFASGGVNYGWSPAATLSNPNISNPVASPSGNTTYYVNVTDANTCNNLDSVKVDIRPDPAFTISPPARICENDSVQLAAGGGDIYSWQPTSSLSNQAISNPVATPSVNTNYSVVITETNCNATTTLTTTITVLPLPLVRASKLNDIDCSNDRSQLNATGATNYLWSPAATLSNEGIANPVAAPVSATKYIVRGTDDAGCINYDSVIVNVENINKGDYLMPNAFTPNGDGLNDCYGIRYWGVIEEVEFSIYNRWGERIFFTKDPNACWDGTYKGTRQDIAVYVYMIKAKTTCESFVFRKGTFALIR